jgi:uncharacterized membrane protein (DUF485 family)
MLTIYALYVVLIYKLRFESKVRILKDRGVIKFEMQKKLWDSFTERKSFLAFLVFFELTFYLWWWANGSSPPGFDIQGLFIAFAVLPIGAEIFSAFLATALLPFTLKKQIDVRVRNFDKRGGLKPISDLLIIFLLLYFVGVLLAFILYPPFISNLLFGSIFIAIGVGVFFIPQIVLHQVLVKKKNEESDKIQKLIDNLEEKILAIDIPDLQNQSAEREMYESYLSSYRTIREEIESMSTWPFDLNGLYKFLLVSTLPAIPLPFVLSSSNNFFPQEGQTVWQWISASITQIPNLPQLYHLICISS